MKELKQLSLHIPISVDKTEIGSITGYFLFSRSKASMILFAYESDHLKAIPESTSLRNSITPLTKNSLAGSISNEAFGCRLASHELYTPAISVKHWSTKPNLFSASHLQKWK